MRVFWAVLGVLMLAAAGYLFMSEGSGAASPAPVMPGEATQPGKASQAPAPSTADPGKPDNPVTAQAPEVPAPGPPPAPAGTGPEPNGPKPEGLAEATKQVADLSEPKEAADGPQEPIARAAEPSPEAPAAAGTASDDPKLVTNADGSVTIDGRYTLRGNGTAEEPYQVSWEHLVSIQEDYAPKEGRDVIPPRVKMLDGKHVQIVGNIAFPMMMDEAEECLVMLNQWDGCCIGIPPTPYDAVEVKLKHIVSGNDRLTTYGSVTGKLKVDPHLVGGWLVGLYVMENATLKPQGFGGFAP
jgi:hypothetical protein